MYKSLGRIEYYIGLGAQRLSVQVWFIYVYQGVTPSLFVPPKCQGGCMKAE